jgi:hypothetical protein
MDVPGAARITERSLIDPARATGHRLVAVAARDGVPLPLDADDAVTPMELIAEAYRAAGFEPCPRTARAGVN